jgi:hypothetical protein
MAMYNLNLLSDHYISKSWKEREHSWKGRGSIDDQKWYVIDLEAIREISDACPSFVRMRYNNHFMPSVYELRRELVYVALDSSWLRKEKVADHSNVVRHLDQNQIEQLFRRRAKILPVEIALRHSAVVVRQDVQQSKVRVITPVREVPHK